MAATPSDKGRPASDAYPLDPAADPRREDWASIPCPVCGFPIGAVRGSKAAICTNCGFKDGCC
ncbi:MAG: hypothetical protein HW416_460 [Chloroflexi bacterium]|nr:hypothetical protein [Chloroflexota bacterium]